MEFFRIFVLVVLLPSIFLANAGKVNLSPCHCPAIYNFGDSNSDTGGMAAAFYPPESSFGQTYFGSPAGRYSDARLIIDFIAKKFRKSRPRPHDFSRAFFVLDMGQNDVAAEDLTTLFQICCGCYGIGYGVWCGYRAKVNGSEVFAGSCANPSKVISRDGVHLSEATNHWIAKRITNGSFSNPSVAISRAYHEA